jgi:hypothetical protein
MPERKVRLGSLADIRARISDVRFTPTTDIRTGGAQSPLGATNGH